MSGTSGDGIDAALVEIRGAGRETRCKLIAFEALGFSAGTRERIFRLFSPATSGVEEICKMNALIGELFARAAMRVIEAAGISAEEVDAIGSHGQTIWHQPVAEEIEGISVTSTLQIGEPCVIAERIGCAVVADFRPRDMAAGGQGAPLVPYVDYLLFRDAEKSRAVQNIGGIGNVTYLPAGKSSEEVIAFDTGPGNMLVDAFAVMLTDGAQTYDRDGLLAGKGRIREELLAYLMGWDYFQVPPPKSTGRELFGVQLARKLWEDRGRFGNPEMIDFVATLTAFTAESIADSYRRWVLPKGPVDEIILGGGGGRNPAMRRMIAERLPGVPVKLHEDYGIDGDAKEAIAFALLANETLCGNPANLPSATGARHAVPLGKIIPPVAKRS